jgi:hypothetical protein
METLRAEMRATVTEIPAVAQAPGVFLAQAVSWVLAGRPSSRAASPALEDCPLREAPSEPVAGSRAGTAASRAQIRVVRTPTSRHAFVLLMGSVVGKLGIKRASTKPIGSAKPSAHSEPAEIWAQVASSSESAAAEWAVRGPAVHFRATVAARTMGAGAKNRA